MSRYAIGLVLVLAAAPLALLHAQPGRWQLVERWRSGGDPTHGITFDEVVDVKRAANGHWLVIAGGAAERLLMLDNLGRPVQVAPSAPRLDRPNGVVQFADGRIVVNEPHAGRLTVLDERGAYLARVPYEPWGYSFRWLGFVHEDGGLYEPIAAGGELVWRRWTPDLTSAELVPAAPCDFGMVSAAPEAVYDIRSPVGGVSVPVPFLQPLLSVVRAPDGGTWAGVGPAYRTIVHTPWQSCDDDRAVVLDGSPQPVSPDDRGRAISRVRQAALGIGAPEPDLTRIPAVHPLFNALFLDRQQRLWVDRHTSPSSRAFEVYAADGRMLAHVPMPEPLDVEKPIAFGDSELAYFTTDEHGWVWLVGMRIQAS